MTHILIIDCTNYMIEPRTKHTCKTNTTNFRLGRCSEQISNFVHEFINVRSLAVTLSNQFSYYYIYIGLIKKSFADNHVILSDFIQLYWVPYVIRSESVSDSFGKNRMCSEMSRYKCIYKFIYIDVFGDIIGYTFVSNFTEYFVNLIFEVEQHMVIHRWKDRNLCV